MPLERHTVRESQALYWLLGQILGTPMEQNIQGTLLYDVRDTGQDVRTGVRYSVTNAETGFHTDNSFGDTVLDYVGLLCLRELPARRAESARQRLHRLEPAGGDRSGGPGDPVRAVPCRSPWRNPAGPAPTVRVPVIQRGTELTYRYLRYWIHSGHEKAGQPLTAGQVRALEALDAVLARPELRVEFMLRPGQMLFTNNRWLLHSRTAFQDHPEPDRRRHLVRLRRAVRDATGAPRRPRPSEYLRACHPATQ